MIEEIRPNLFRVEIPLPRNPLKYVNSYVVRSPDKSLIVDTGLNHEQCYQAMTDGLSQLGVDPEKAYFFITHLHADHYGLLLRLATDPKRVYFSRPESEIMENWTGWEPMVAYAARNGFPENQLRKAVRNHPGFKHGSAWVPDPAILQDGDIIEFGGYAFTCIETPGHSHGHICLYEPEQKILIAGDHVLGDITPNIQCWSDQDNNLGDYLDSLDKVGRLEVELVLPGHRRIFRDLYTRIKELKEHHQRRMAEVLDILGQAPRHAFDTASHMTWDLKGTWDEFPLIQKWFATTEATAHLRYGHEAGNIFAEERNGVVIYHRK